jgi:hypothetical protein
MRRWSRPGRRGFGGGEPPRRGVALIEAMIDHDTDGTASPLTAGLAGAGGATALATATLATTAPAATALATTAPATTALAADPAAPDPRKAALAASREYLGMGVTIGAVGLVSAAVIGATCPLCVVAAPAFLGLGAYKRWQARRR